MSTELLLLAESASDLITWQERLASPFQHHLMQLSCSVLIGAVLGLLGCFVILRRMALIGDAISHAVLPGVVIAFLLVSTGIGGLFVGALVAGIATAVGINLVTRFSRAKEDAAIGIVFTAMFALGIVLISRLPAGTHFDMKCFLFGDPLAIQQSDLVGILIIAPLVLATVVWLFHPLKLFSFDATLARTMGFNTTVLHYTLMILLSATVVAALRSVGVIMAVAMLITPAACAYQLTNRLWTMLLWSSTIGALSAGAGMFLAFQVDAPPGPIMVLVATGVFVVVMAVAPERGFIMQYRRRRKIQAHIVEEDILKTLVRHEEKPAVVPADPVRALAPLSATRVQAGLRRLAQRGLVRLVDGTAHLSDAGREQALTLLRAHRLWETYLADQQIASDLVHPEAERLEHAHELADRLAESLGDPDSDPHGHPIPPAAPAGQSD